MPHTMYWQALYSLPPLQQDEVRVLGEREGGKVKGWEEGGRTGQWRKDGWEGSWGRRGEFPDSDLASLNSDVNCNKFECTYSM